MKKNLHITKNAVLKREKNTLVVLHKEDEKLIKNVIPVEKLSSIYISGSVTIKAGALKMLLKLGIPIHYLSSEGEYLGTVWPREYLLAGIVVVRQSQFYLDSSKRIELAKKFVLGSYLNMVNNLKEYASRSDQIKESITNMQALTIGIMNAKSIDELMAYEGNIREIYYKAWNNFLPQEFSFDKRTRMPPKSMINAMISFGNSLTYSVCLSEIYRTQLSPVISFLHEPSERRFSLSLDLAEIFKPILTDKTIFYLINKKIIDHNYFSVEAGFYFLNERGKKLFIEEFEKRLNQTIETPSGNKISIQKAIKVEAYKIIKHLLGIKEYQPLVIS